jgi:hypothetical protein
MTREKEKTLRFTNPREAIANAIRNPTMKGPAKLIPFEMEITVAEAINNKLIPNANLYLRFFKSFRVMPLVGITLIF